MAKFTVFFKDKPIFSEMFDEGVIHIGRDETNDLTVDSLAVAPAHAAVVMRSDGVLIKQLNENFPLNVNGINIKESMLVNDDKITIGKHSIVFNTTEAFINAQPGETIVSKDLDLLNQEIEPVVKMPEANLQIIDGKHIGRMIPLKRSMTRLGHNGGSIAVIARRREGYFISALETENDLKVNSQILDDSTIKLSNNDLVVIDNTTMQFFLTNT